MSEIRATTISNLAGTGPATLTGQYAAKAWVNFDGTGTVAIRESANVASITDNGTGDYILNFTTALTDANYAVAGSGDNSGNTETLLQAIATKTVTQCRVLAAKPGVSVGDPIFVSVVIFR